MTQTVLVMGGTSGLGLRIANILSENQNVIVTGRKDPGIHRFYRIDLNSAQLGNDLDAMFTELPRIDHFVYAAGFYQEGRMDSLHDKEIASMINVGLTAPALTLKRLLKKQDALSGFLAITSSSQYTPRELEPVYTGVKAGLAMLAKSVSLDNRVEKTLVVAPGGMNTPFWEGQGKDLDEFLDPVWVAQEIVNLYGQEFNYAFAKIPREPREVQLVEKR